MNPISNSSIADAPPVNADEVAELTAPELLGLWERIDHDEQAEQSPAAVPLGKLVIAPRVFRTREPSGADWDQTTHIRHLAKTVKQGEPLDPLTVLDFGPCGYVVVDGHLRLEAYRRAGLKPTARIPVAVTNSSPVEALGDALRQRTKTRLPMTPAERQEATWRLVLMNAAKRIHTQVEIAECTGSTPRSVKRMKKAMEEAVAEGFDPQGATWKEMLGRNRPLLDRDDDEVESWREKQVAHMAKRMGDALNNRPHEDPELFADAVVKLMGRRGPQVAAALLHLVPADDLSEYLSERYGITPELPPDDF